VYGNKFTKLNFNKTVDYFSSVLTKSKHFAQNFVAFVGDVGDYGAYGFRIGTDASGGGEEDPASVYGGADLLPEDPWRLDLEPVAPLAAPVAPVAAPVATLGAERPYPRRQPPLMGRTGHALQSSHSAYGNHIVRGKTRGNCSRYGRIISCSYKITS
jgi:hypothetical protein